ncbi:MAG: glycosyl hydrolase family 17 protein, partial [Pseudomonadota bacterium]
MSNAVQRPSVRPLPPHGNAICYSGYREGQHPGHGIYPSHQEIREDLLILAAHWQYLRLYDCGPHAQRVLEVIAREQLPLRVMLGIDLAAEMSNPACPWGAHFDDATLATHRRDNERRVSDAIDLAASHDEHVIAVSIGNEASVEWTDHLVPVERLVSHATRVREGTTQPVTFCDNYVPWHDKLRPLAEVLDAIAIHTYPVWEYRSIEDALAYTQENYRSVAEIYTDKPVIITEAGWTTQANGRGIEPHNASEELQAIYCEQLLAWTREERILTFVFEAFDEPWKGSDDPEEPEKHWGLYRVDRSPKP